MIKTEGNDSRLEATEPVGGVSLPIQSIRLVQWTEGKITVDATKIHPFD